VSPLDALRQRMLSAGSDEQQIAILRMTLAGSDDARKLRAVSVCVSELAEIAADCFLDTLGDLKDRCHEKLTRVGGSDLPVRRASPSQGGGHEAAPGIKMSITRWTTDANGVLSRLIYNADAPQ
jgi:hypothetical protein